jgi:hypothetical protein
MESTSSTWEGGKRNVGKRQIEYGTEMGCLPGLGKRTTSTEGTLPRGSCEKNSVYAKQMYNVTSKIKIHVT